jgi:hypothetical protein
MEYPDNKNVRYNLFIKPLLPITVTKD